MEPMVRTVRAPRLVYKQALDVKITMATTLWIQLRKTWPSLYGALEPEEAGHCGR